MLLSRIQSDRQVSERRQFLHAANAFLILAVFWVWTAAPSARAAQLTLLTNAPPGTPLVISPAKAQSQLLVSVINSTATDPSTEFMTAWQFRLVIEPDAGAIGTVQFDAGAKPTPYVFDSATNLGAPSSVVNGVFSALDVAFPPSPGVQIPTAPGANLQLVSFTPSTDAIGDFGIYAEGSSDTFWDDGNDSARTFVNVPSSAMVHIADVFVNPAGDFNRDGHVNAADIAPMEQALANPAGYEAAHNNLTASQLLLIEDVNGDQKFTNADLQKLLVDLRNGGGSADPAPEPASFLLLGLMLPTVVLLARSKRRSFAESTVQGQALP